jgi:hypothetical protein
MEYLELIRTREILLSNLKKDYLKLIKKAERWAKKQGFEAGKIIEIQVWVTYYDNIRGYKFSGSEHEKIYITDDAVSRNTLEKREYLGKSVKVNGNDYHLEIILSSSSKPATKQKF